MSRVCRGVLVRALYSACITLITLLVVVMYEGQLVGSVHWVYMAGVAGLFIEFFVTWRSTQGFDWKWFSPCTVIFCTASLIGIWMAQIRYISYKVEGVYVCYNASAAEEIQRNDFSAVETWLDFCMCGHCTGAAEQLFLALLIVGKYLLPKGVSFYHTEDRVHNFLASLAKTHLILAITCNAADVMDVVSHTRMPGIRGEYGSVSIVLLLFSLGCVQFCLNIFSTTEEKRSDLYIIVETDLWSSIVIMVTCDLPYMILRFYFLLTAKVYSPFALFFLCKNILYICFTIHKIIMVCYGKDMNEIEEYVNTDPGLPPLPRFERENTRLDETPDGLDDISETHTVYSNEIPVKSRNEKRQLSAADKQTNDWGDDSQWFSSPSLKKTEKSKLHEQPPLSPQQIALPKEWDVESQMPDKNGMSQKNFSGPIPTHYKGYFTDNYIADFEANLDFSKIGTRDEIILPLGAVVMRGEVDFTNAPEPQIRNASSPISRTPEQTVENENNGLEEEKEEKSKKKKKKKDKKNRDSDIDESVNDILEDEEPKERKKKKMKDRKENNEEGLGEDIKKNKDGEIGSDGEVEQKKKKKKKKKSKSEDREDGENESEHEDRKLHKKRHKELEEDDYL